MRMAFKYNVSERLFNEPTANEIKQMITKSELPKRAKLALKLIKLFGLANRNLEKKKISKKLKIAYKLGKLLSH
jgi:hypothetical protein